MSSSQAARTLIRSLKPGYEVTISIIYRVVQPLTFEKVKQELLMAEEEQTYISPSLIQSSHHATQYLANPSQLTKCTIERCVGNTFQNPHKPDQCFKQPANFAKRDEWINKQDENKKRFKRRNYQHQANHSDSTSFIRGVKIVRAPTASANHAMTFLIDFQPTSSNQHANTDEVMPNPVNIVDMSNAFIQVPVSTISSHPIRLPFLLLFTL
jgi:hypothetical protein